MFGDPQTLVVFLLVSVAVGAAAYALLFPKLSGAARVEERQKTFLRAEDRNRNRATQERGVRRQQVAETLKELERKQKPKNREPLPIKLQRSGLDWTPSKFYVMSAVLGMTLGFVALGTTGSLAAFASAAFAGSLGVPRWLLNMRIKRRQAKFLKEFPNAIDIVVRGVRSGLPVGDCMRIVASEAQEPVRSEFKAIMETQAIGMPLAEAIERLVDRVGVPEANFFAIVISIQAKSGGSLSDALGNLSKVLRDRHRMKAKVQALAAEAKSSAWIIGAMPFLVSSFVYMTNPTYLEPLWNTPMGNLLLGFSGLWMLMGVLVMRRMINFEV